MIKMSEILEIRRGSEFKEYPLTKQKITIGRSSDNDVVLNEQFISRRHAQIIWDKGSLYITDLKSENGTMVNNRKLEPNVLYPIKDGDTIVIESFSLTLRLRKFDSGTSESITRQNYPWLHSKWFAIAATILGMAALFTILYFATSWFKAQETALDKTKPAIVRIDTDEGVSTGTIIGPSGYVLTCKHILDNTKNLAVTLSDGSQYGLNLVTTHETRDLAILKIASSDVVFKIAQIGDSNNAKVGDEIFVVGYSMGTIIKGDPSFTKGIISAFRDMDQTRYIQTDATFNEGNSGGALINLNGELMGIPRAKLKSELQVENTSFAITINDVKPFITPFIK